VDPKRDLSPLLLFGSSPVSNCRSSKHVLLIADLLGLGSRFEIYCVEAGDLFDGFVVDAVMAGRVCKKSISLLIGEELLDYASISGRCMCLGAV
jgi:hypothetical protein